jgi:hypothetical protein
MIARKVLKDVLKLQLLLFIVQQLKTLESFPMLLPMSSL